MKNARKVVDQFSGERRLRTHSNHHFGGISAAKLYPLAFCRFRPDEGGTVSTTLNVTPAPVAGYMRSNAIVDVKQVFVPYQAIEKLKLDTQDDAGVTEMTRRRLMSGEGIGLEEEGEISLAANVHARTVSDVNLVSESVRLAYIAAVNHLRLHAFFKATLLTKADTAIAPAILTANILDRFRGVSEPETLIDGAVNLTGDLPVKGIGFRDGSNYDISSETSKETGGETVTGDYSTRVATGPNPILAEDPDNPGFPLVTADLSGAGEVTLRDLMESKLLDQIIRRLAGLRRADPVHGEEAIERALYGISVDFDDNCHVTYDRVHSLKPAHMRPTDGASFSDVSAEFVLDDSFATLVPRSELGGQLVTLISFKPLEVLSAQPDPAQTEAWVVENRIEDELQLDEVIVTRQDLETGVSAANQDQEAFWTGHNSIKHEYATQGANAQMTFETEMRSSMWVYPIPTAVDEENVNYPDEIDMYPFYDWNGSHAEYTIRQSAVISTPLALGPTPIERIELFKDNPDLVS